MLNNPDLSRLMVRQHHEDLMAQARNEALARLAPRSPGWPARALARLRDLHHARLAGLPEQVGSAAARAGAAEVELGRAAGQRAG